MFNKDDSPITIGEYLVYQNLPEDILSYINKLTN